MVGGFDRYFQIARCLRDEDLRADRQFEFSQLDMECSFASQDDVMAFVSEAVLDAAEAATGERPPPIERMTWADALDRYGTDKPDLRFGMELVDLTEVFEGTEVKAFSSPTVKALVVPEGAAYPRSRLDELTEQAKKAGRGRPGLVPRRRRRRRPRSTGPWPATCPSRKRRGVLAADRGGSGGPHPGRLGPVHARRARCSGRCASPSGRRRSARARTATSGSSTSRCSRASAPTATRSRRTTRSPCRTPRTCPLLATDPLAVRSQAYDLVLNGWELGSGSVRIHRRDIQSQVFAALGIAPEEAEARFGFLLGAFRYGAPPHAGFAFGVDRLVAILAGEENIREVIAYPKTQSGADLLTGAPTPLPAASLAELGIRVVVPPPSHPGRHGPRRTPARTRPPTPHNGLGA